MYAMNCSDFLSSTQHIARFWRNNKLGFGECFEQTVLAWIPCGITLLLILLKLTLYRSGKSKIASLEEIGNSSWFRALRIGRHVCIIALFILSCIRLIGIPILQFNRFGYADTFVWLSLAFRSECIFILLLLSSETSRNSKPSGPIEAIAAIAFLLFGFPELITQFRVLSVGLNAPLFDSLTYIFQHLLFLLCAVLFAINLRKDKLQDNSWPETRAALPNRLFFGFYWKILINGYKRLLSEDDMWQLDNQEESIVVFEKFVKWQRHYSKKYKRHPGISLSMALYRTFRSIILFAVFLITLKEFLSFFAMLIFIRILNFLADPTELRWHGWIYIASLFILLLCRGLCVQHRDFWIIKLGIRVKAAMSTAVARKALILSSDASNVFTPGEIINFAAVDSGRMMEDAFSWHFSISIPLQCFLSAYIILRVAGAAAWPGFGVILVSAVVLSCAGFLIVKQVLKMFIFRDQRMQIMKETLNNIKIIKFYAWEIAFQRIIEKIRLNEIKRIRTLIIYGCPIDFLLIIGVPLSCITIYAVYTLTFGRTITAELVFVVAATFRFQFSDYMTMSEWFILVSRLGITIQKIGIFLSAEELVDYVQKQPRRGGESAITVQHGCFAYSSPELFTLGNISLAYRSPKLVAVTGSVGSGKSSLINAILGEMKLTSGSVEISGTVAYASQEAWLFNDTVKGNILFGLAFDRERYEKVLAACALLPDLAILPAGDVTEVGERGINLSGGQKQRIALARAVYQDRDIYLLDDSLSAVDVHVQRHLFEEVIGPSGLLKDKLRLLVTNSTSFLAACDEIVLIEDGKIRSAGPYQGTRDYMPEHRTDERKTDISKKSVSDKSAEQNEHESDNGKLVDEEVMEFGTVTWKAYWLYMNAGGPPLLAVTILVAVAYMLDAASIVWLGYWTDNVHVSKDGSSTDVSNSEGLTVLGIIIASQAVVGIAAIIPGILFPYRASRIIHEKLLVSILRMPMSFFDCTPVGRILNRCGKDMFVVDIFIYVWVAYLLHTCSSAFFGTIPAIIASPTLLVFIVPAVVGLTFFQRILMSSARQFQRLEATTRSPVFSQIGNMIQGASNIRVYGRQHDFILQYHRMLDKNSQAQIMLNTCQQWLGVNLTIVCTLITCAAATTMMIKTSISPGMIGMSIATLLGITDILMFTGRRLCQLETYMVSMERLSQYLSMKPEAEWTRRQHSQGNILSGALAKLAQRRKSRSLEVQSRSYGTFINKRSSIKHTMSDEEYGHLLSPISKQWKCTADQELLKQMWPTEGRIEFIDYSLRYRPGLPLALNNLNFVIESGQKVGVVGRTGSGKTSLTLGLFRIIEPASGSILIDSVDISTLGLHELRHELSIIPQEPAIFSGTIRQNLDPLEEFRDDDMWLALEQCQLKDYVRELPNGLDTVLADGGANVSMGQRQLICLTRALLKRSKILVLDEATACVDLETDKFIQSTIRAQFAKCTVITIAHRIETILDCDRIAVLSDGQLVEYGPVDDLLRNESTEFSSLVKRAGLRPNGNGH